MVLTFTAFEAKCLVQRSVISNMIRDKYCCLQNYYPDCGKFTGVTASDDIDDNSKSRSTIIMNYVCM